MIQIFIWFFLFPDNRFSGSAFWWFGAGLGSYLIYNVKLFHSIIILILSIITIGFSTHLFDSIGNEKIFFPTNIEKNVTQFTIDTYQTNSGLSISVPTGDNECWDSPIPCSPNPNPKLSLLQKNNIKSGFYIVNKKNEDN